MIDAVKNYLFNRILVFKCTETFLGYFSISVRQLQSNFFLLLAAHSNPIFRSQKLAAVNTSWKKLLVSVLFSIGTMHPTAVPLINTLCSRLVMQTRLHKLQEQNSLSTATSQDKATENRNLWNLLTVMVLYNCSKVIQDTDISRNVHLAYFICIKVIITKMKKKIQKENRKKKKSRIS